MQEEKIDTQAKRRVVAAPIEAKPIQRPVLRL